MVPSYNNLLFASSHRVVALVAWSNFGQCTATLPLQKRTDLVCNVPMIWSLSVLTCTCCKGITKRADPFTAWEEAQADPENADHHTVDILEELDSVPKAEGEDEKYFIEAVEIQLHPTIPPSTSS